MTGDAVSGGGSEPDPSTPQESTPHASTDTGSAGPGDPGVDDLAVPVPMWLTAPLALACGGGFIAAFGASRLLVSLLPFALYLALVAVIDLRELRIPNRLTATALIVGAPLLVVASTADWPELSLMRAVFGALAMCAVYLVLALIWPQGMGMGDVKLALVLGAQLGLFGWIEVGRGVLIAHVLMGPVAVVLLVIGRAGRRTALPFGPFLVAGAAAALLIEGFA